jgi:hypothetical protein
MADELALRLMKSLQDFLGTPIVGDADREAARASLAALAFKKRDEDAQLTPESEAEKAPRFIATARDQGRHIQYAPIRILSLELTIRVNAKVAKGKVDQIAPLYGALETLFQLTNLKEALHSEARGIAIMRATVPQGITHRAEGDLRLHTLTIDVRAVAFELVEN